MWAEASWVGIQVVAFSLSYWFFSVNRAILLWFPLWIMIGSLGCWPRPFSAASSGAGGLCVRRRDRAHAVVELAVLHRTLGKLKVCVRDH